MIKKYSWNECEDGNWNNPIYSSRKEALEDAKLYYLEEELPNGLYTGELIPYVPSIDIYNILDNLNTDAYEEVGELAYDWETYDFKKKDEIDELANAMNTVLWNWLEKYNRMPNFCALKDIKYHNIKGGKND